MENRDIGSATKLLARMHDDGIVAGEHGIHDNNYSR